MPWYKNNWLLITEKTNREDDIQLLKLFLLLELEHKNVYTYVVVGTALELFQNL